MKSKINRAAILFIFIFLFTGCGKVQPDTTPKPLNTVSDKNNPSSGTTAEESNETFLNQKEEAEQTPPPKKAAISLKEHYSDSNRYISVLGLKEYRKAFRRNTVEIEIDGVRIPGEEDVDQRRFSAFIRSVEIY